VLEQTEPLFFSNITEHVSRPGGQSLLPVSTYSGDSVSNITGFRLWFPRHLTIRLIASSNV